MKFEEILPLLRNGKKVKRNIWDKNDYVMGYIGILLGEKFEDLTDEEKQARLNIIRCKNGKTHIEMIRMPPFLYCTDIMSDDWELCSGY